MNRIYYLFESEKLSERLEKSLVGACGVFYVSAELSRRGWIAMPTIRNTKGIDIIASKGDKTVNIQVKTNSYGKPVYPLTQGNENLVSTFEQKTFGAFAFGNFHLRHGSVPLEPNGLLAVHKRQL